jgi:hypothetical protein
MSQQFKLFPTGNLCSVGREGYEANVGEGGITFPSSGLSQSVVKTSRKSRRRGEGGQSKSDMKEITVNSEIVSQGSPVHCCNFHRTVSPTVPIHGMGNAGTDVQKIVTVLSA